MSFCQKNQEHKLNICTVKLLKTFLYEKVAHKMLVKLIIKHNFALFALFSKFQSNYLSIFSAISIFDLNIYLFVFVIRNFFDYI